MRFRAAITCHSRTGVPDPALRELVATGLAELDAQVLAISPIPTTGRVTVALGLEATSEQEARERIADAISSAGRFGALGWSIASLYTSGRQA